MSFFILGIDATRNKSGGAIVHLVNILKHFNPDNHSIQEIHLWSYENLLNQIPNYPWLVKHCPEPIKKGLINQLFWQYFTFPSELKDNNCLILFSTDAGSVCRFRPFITMSRDMLSFEKDEFKRYLFSFSWIRLYLLKYVQLSSFKNSLATIFLTNYAKKKISESHKIGYDSKVINHGISDDFRINKKNKKNLSQEHEIILTYISNADLYKHNWNLIEAVYRIRVEYKMNLKLQLLGSKEGNFKALQKIEESVNKFDSKDEFILRTRKLNHEELISYLKITDIFIFASTCENMPNTLIEGMSSSLPILCSSYGPMPEIIQDAAILFDPEDVDSIKNALCKMITDDELRIKLAQKSSQLSKKYSWERCSNETFDFITNTIKKYKNESE